jgi:segregation and condensation protein B
MCVVDESAPDARAAAMVDAPVVDGLPRAAGLPGESASPVAPEMQVTAMAEADGASAPLDQVLEALLFSADAPLTAARLADLTGVGVREVRRQLAALNAKYEAVGLSFRIEEIARGYQMLSRAAFQPWLLRLNKTQAQTRLSAAALETLSIVAYKQPIIRADVEAIRGVSCGDTLNRLREMGLIKIIGRADIVGRPILYGTTRKFLDVFGLADLGDLPPMEALTLRRAPAVAPASSIDPSVPMAAAGA